MIGPEFTTTVSSDIHQGKPELFWKLYAFSYHENASYEKAP